MNSMFIDPNDEEHGCYFSSFTVSPDPFILGLWAGMDGAKFKINGSLCKVLKVDIAQKTVTFETPKTPILFPSLIEIEDARGQE